VVVMELETTVKRPTLRPGDGVWLFDWPNATQKRGKRRSRSHCPIHAACGKRCKQAEWHQLCKMHEMAVPSDHRRGSIRTLAAETRKPNAGA